MRSKKTLSAGGLINIDIVSPKCYSLITKIQTAADTLKPKGGFKALCQATGRCSSQKYMTGLGSDASTLTGLPKAKNFVVTRFLFY
jgi:hypothetical protein